MEHQVHYPADTLLVEVVVEAVELIQEVVQEMVVQV